MENDIDIEVRDFIDRYIDSVEQLEILLLLSESAPKAWSPKEVNDRIHSNLVSVDKRLQGLCASNLLTCAGGQYTYRGNDLKQSDAIERLLSFYKSRKIRIIEMIFSKPKDGLKDFADAFKIRKDPKNG